MSASPLGQHRHAPCAMRRAACTACRPAPLRPPWLACLWACLQVKDVLYGPSYALAAAVQLLMPPEQLLAAAGVSAGSSSDSGSAGRRRIRAAGLAAAASGVVDRLGLTGRAAKAAVQAAVLAAVQHLVDQAASGNEEAVVQVWEGGEIPDLADLADQLTAAAQHMRLQDLQAMLGCLLPQLEAAVAVRNASGSPVAQQLAVERCAALGARKCANLSCTNAALLLSASNSSAAGSRPRRCGGCRSVRYCSDACCRADWRAHRRACRLAQPAAAERQGQQPGEAAALDVMAVPLNQLLTTYSDSETNTVLSKPEDSPEDGPRLKLDRGWAT